MAAAWMDERDPELRLRGARHGPPAVARSGARRASSSRRRSTRSSSSSATAASGCGSASCPRAHALRAGEVEGGVSVPPRQLVARTTCCRPCARRTSVRCASRGSQPSPPVLVDLAPRPRPPRSSVPSGRRVSTPSSMSRSRDEELERRPRPAACVEHAVDLPLGEQRRRPRAVRPPSRRTRQPAERAAPAPRPARPPARAVSSPTATSYPASRSAFVSEPNVCQ